MQCGDFGTRAAHERAGAISLSGRGSGRARQTPMGTRFLMAVLPVLLLVPAADGHEPLQPPEQEPHWFFHADVVGGGDSVHADRLPAVAIPAILAANGQSLRDRCSALAARPDEIRANPPMIATVTVDVMVVFSEARSRDRPAYSAENWIRLASCLHEVSRSPVRLRLAGWRVARGQTAAMMAGFENGSRGDADRQRLLEVMATETVQDRNALEADVVVGVGERGSGTNYTGWAFGLRYGRERAMAMVMDRWGSGSADRDWRGTARTIAHEIGHVLGLGHGDSDQCSGAHLPYACAVDGRNATVMSTEGFRNWRRPFFSTARNDEVDLGLPFDDRYSAPGDDRHDNVRALRETAHVVASYRGRSWARVPEPGPEPEPEPEPTPDNCRPGRTCLQNGFAVRVNYTTDGGRTIGTATLSTHLGRDSAAFWFFDPNNAEVLLKVLNGCAVNGHWWVYAAPATDVEYWVSVWPPAGITRPDGVAYKGYQQPIARAHETDSETTWVAAITDRTAFRCR